MTKKKKKSKSKSKKSHDQPTPHHQHQQTHTTTSSNPKIVTQSKKRRRESPPSHCAAIVNNDQGNNNKKSNHKNANNKHNSQTNNSNKNNNANKTIENNESVVIPHVIKWLENRKKKIPDALLQQPTSALSPFIDMNHIISLLPSLRERERRALLRHVDKCIHNPEGEGAKKKEELQDSDGEYDTNSDNPKSSANGEDAGNSNSNSNWPTQVEFSNNYKYDPTIPSEIKEKYCPSGTVRQRASRPSSKVYYKRINDPDHPAHGEFGLFCAIPHAMPGTWLLDYVGHVTRGEDQDKTSDYVSDFGERSELACDANSYGNEARFLNDFRNTGKHPNVEFNIRRDKNGELRQGVYVKLAKDAKTKDFNGIQQHEELLVSYGKSYWRSRIPQGGNLTDFVWRLPGRPMPEGGKPNTPTS